MSGKAFGVFESVLVDVPLEIEGTPAAPEVDEVGSAVPDEAPWAVVGVPGAAEVVELLLRLFESPAAAELDVAGPKPVFWLSLSAAALEHVPWLLHAAVVATGAPSEQAVMAMRKDMEDATARFIFIRHLCSYSRQFCRKVASVFQSQARVQKTYGFSKKTGLSRFPWSERRPRGPSAVECKEFKGAVGLMIACESRPCLDRLRQQYAVERVLDREAEAKP